jgi:hypothetical protein
LTAPSSGERNAAATWREMALAAIEMLAQSTTENLRLRERIRSMVAERRTPKS